MRKFKIRCNWRNALSLDGMEFEVEDDATEAEIDEVMNGIILDRMECSLEEVERDDEEC